MPNTNTQSLTTDHFRWLRNALGALALTLALLTVVASTAGARPPGPDPQAFEAANPTPTIVRVSTPSGFDWGDAGIGAAGGLAIALIALGGTLAIAHRHDHRPAGPAGPIG